MIPTPSPSSLPPVSNSRTVLWEKPSSSEAGICWISPMDLVHVMNKLTSFIHPEPSLELKSPVPHLHTCNDVPSDEEKILVQQALQKLERRRNELLHEMECTAVRELTGSKRRVLPPPDLKLLEGFRNGLMGVLSPIRRLPPEVLQEIFLCGFGGPETRNRRFDSPPESLPVSDTHWPWTLSQTCRRWKQICLETPSLWSRLPVLELKWKDERSKEINRKKRLFALMVERSRDAPLDIFIRGPRTDTPASTHPILEMLVSASSRWGIARLELGRPTFNAFFRPIQTRLQRLTRLRFYLYYQYQHVIPFVWEVFSDAPRLQHIDMKVFQVQVGNENDPLTSLPHPLHTFICNPNLHSLMLDISFESDILNAPISSITLPRLKRLKLVLLNKSTPSFVLLNAITAPSLDEFIIENSIHFDHHQEVLLLVLAFIRRSSAPAMSACPLKKLRLHLASVESDILVSIVELLPDLSVLEVPLTRNTLQLLSRLSSTNQAAVIAPHLEFCIIQAPCVPYVINVQGLHSAVNRLAEARFYENLSDHASSDIQPFKRLKALTVRCNGFLRVLSSHHRVLEDCRRPTQNNADVVVRPTSTLNGVVKTLSAITKGPVTLYEYECIYPSWPTANVAVNILEALKHYYEVENIDARDIYIPQLHTQLQILGKWIEDNVAQKKWETMSHILRDLQKAIRRTLAKWYFMLDEHVPQIRWVAISRDVLMYVPSDHAIRFSSESIRLARVGEVGDACSKLHPFYELFTQGIYLDDS